MRIGRRSLPLTEKQKAGKRELRNFGLLFAALGVLAGAYMVWKGYRSAWIPLGLAGVFLLTGLSLPRALGPFYRSWMRFAAMLAWLNTRLLLSIFFFLVMMPIGLVMRLFGKDLLNKRIDRSAASYWIKRDLTAKDKQSYEHLF